MTINKAIELPNKPDHKVSVSSVFNIDSKLSVKAFKNKTDWVPEIDDSYVLIKIQLYLFLQASSITGE